MDYLIFPAILIIGILTKFADLMADENLRVNKFWGYVFGLAYGILIAFVVITSPILATIGFAVVIATIVTKKIDHPFHYTGIATLLFLLSAFGFPKVDFILLILFLLAGMVDEIGNNLADKGKFKGFLSFFFKQHLTLEVVVFGVSAYTGFWILFFGILSFDIGYNLTEKLGSRFIS
jgi:hypothetical protein